jgi:hypothetical protein
MHTNDHIGRIVRQFWKDYCSGSQDRVEQMCSRSGNFSSVMKAALGRNQRPILATTMGSKVTPFGVIITALDTGTEARYFLCLHFYTVDRQIFSLVCVSRPATTERSFQLMSVAEKLGKAEQPLPGDADETEQARLSQLNEKCEFAAALYIIEFCSVHTWAKSSSAWG